MEKPLFEVTSCVTRESCRAQARARAGQHNRIIWLVNVLMALSVAILWSVGSFHRFWMTALLALLVLQTLLRTRIDGWRMYSARNESAPEAILSFGEDDICVKSRVEESRIGYDSVTGLAQDSRYVIVLLRHHTPLVVRKEEVPGARAIELEHFLTRRTGMAFRTLRG